MNYRNISRKQPFNFDMGELMRLPTSHFSDPIPFPPNLAIIGTMDTLDVPLVGCGSALANNHH